jgi:hypothetical protein
MHEGVIGIPGSGGFTANIEVVGGQYGIWQDAYRPNPSASGVRLVNQTAAAVLITSTVLGFDKCDDQFAPEECCGDSHVHVLLD